MQDFRLKVFLTAARTLNFTKCAEQLYISQPAVSKNISELEKHYGVKLFVRRGSGLMLTEAGHLLCKWADKIMSMHLQLEHEMSLLGQYAKGELRIGASTTIAQYVLPSIIAGFSRVCPNIRVTMLSANSEKVEQALFSKKIELGFVENVAHRGGLHYEHFADDRLVVVAGGRSHFKPSLSLTEFAAAPFVLREEGSGTLELISRRLSSAGITLSSLNVQAYLGSSEAIKSYVLHSNALAIISVAAVADEVENGKLRIIHLPELEFDREFSSVVCQGDHNALVSRFLSFAENNIGNFDNF